VLEFVRVAHHVERDDLFPSHFDRERLDPVIGVEHEAREAVDAYDARREKVDSRNIPITVIEPPIKIDSFTASPYAANFAAGPVDVALSWKVTPDYAVKRVELEGQGIVTGQTSYVVRGVKEPTTFHLRATGLGDDEQTASVQAQSLSEHLVGRSYQVNNLVFWDNPKKYVMDIISFLSPSKAHYHVYIYCPAVWDSKDVDGTWSLVGSTIQVVTSLGTLLFDYRADAETGDALYFENPPYLEAFGDGYTRLMTPS